MKTQKKEVFTNDSGFKFIEFRYDSHDHKTLRLWLNNLIDTVTKDSKEFVQFPINDAKIHRTDKGTYVIRPSVGYHIYLVEIDSGYRGNAKIESVNNIDMVIRFEQFHSGQGNLGITACALVNGSDYIDVEWQRSGRRIDKTNGVTRYHSNGSTSEALDDTLASLL